jgi:hypothetical protein
MRRRAFLRVSRLALFGAGAAWRRPGDAGDRGPGRFLLVSSEGLYVVEADGSCSWSYTVPPMNGRSAVAFDDLTYDGWALASGNFLYAAHRYAREIDPLKRTVWEYRVEGLAEVKSCVPLAGGRVAVLNSQEQCILELAAGTAQVLRRIPVPASGTLHSRYNLLRRTPDGNYLVALRAENRFVEVDVSGDVRRSFPVPSLPVVAQRTRDGATLCTGSFGLKLFDAGGQERWSFTPGDAARQFPLLIAGGVAELPGGAWLVVNSDWHYQKAGENRVQLFVVDAARSVRWSLPVTAFAGWKRGEIEPKTGFTEHRCMMVQILPKRTP